MRFHRHLARALPLLALLGLWLGSAIELRAQFLTLPPPLANGTAPGTLTPLMPIGPGETIQVRKLSIEAQAPRAVPSSRTASFRIHTQQGIHHLLANLDFTSGNDDRPHVIDQVLPGFVDRWVLPLGWTVIDKQWDEQIEDPELFSEGMYRYHFETTNLGSPGMLVAPSQAEVDFYIPYPSPYFRYDSFDGWNIYRMVEGRTARDGNHLEAISKGGVSTTPPFQLDEFIYRVPKPWFWSGDTLEHVKRNDPSSIGDLTMIDARALNGGGSYLDALTFGRMAFYNTFLCRNVTGRSLGRGALKLFVYDWMTLEFKPELAISLSDAPYYHQVIGLYNNRDYGYYHSIDALAAYGGNPNIAILGQVPNTVWLKMMVVFDPDGTIQTHEDALQIPEEHRAYFDFSLFRF